MTIEPEDIENLGLHFADLASTVGTLKGGFDVLSGTNQVVTTRLDSLENQMGDVRHELGDLRNTLSRIESFLLNEKEHGKRVADPSCSQEAKVRPSSPLISSVENQLGYRGILNSLEHRTGMLRKVELPCFDGLHPTIWLNRAERFFRLGYYTDQDKFDLISITFEGAVLNWFNIEMAADPFTDWAEFRKRLITRFAHRVKEEPGKRLFCLRQKGTVSEYVNEFEELRSLVTGIDEANLEHVFFNG